MKETYLTFQQPPMVGEQLTSQLLQAPKADEVQVDSPYTFTKLKINKEHFLELDYLETRGNVTSSHHTQIFQPVHEDLLQALSRMRVHLCLLTELVNKLEVRRTLYLNGYISVEGGHWMEETAEAGTLYNPELWTGYTCTGVIIKPEGLMLMGYKELSNGKRLNIISPLSDPYEGYEIPDQKRSSTWAVSMATGCSWN